MRRYLQDLVRGTDDTIYLVAHNGHKFDEWVLCNNIFRFGAK